MIIQFKIFENKIIFDTKQYWYISGDRLDVSRILMKLIEKLNNYDRDVADQLKDIIYDMQKKANANDIYYGVVIYMDSIGHIKYTPIKDENHKNDIKYKTEFIYQGEIKIEKGKPVLDKIEIDINKYNL